MFSLNQQFNGNLNGGTESPSVVASQWPASPATLLQEQLLGGMGQGAPKQGGLVT